MHRRDRKRPLLWGTESWRQEYRRLLAAGWLPEYARDNIRFINVIQTIIPGRDEKCGAMTRAGTPCRRKPLKNGRCPNHGGLSTGPRTEEGKKRALANLKPFRQK